MKSAFTIATAWFGWMFYTKPAEMNVIVKATLHAAEIWLELILQVLITGFFSSLIAYFWCHLRRDQP